jgi:type II secretory pathway pseudopilin PulG
MHIRQAGFSFIELAVAMFIMTMLIGSILVPLATQVEQRQNSEAQRILEEARDALLGHAIINGYLPCPDTDGDGAENVSGSNCATISASIAHGTFPWQTLGLAPSDAWGNRIRYAVREEYARRTMFSLTTTAPNLRVCETSTCASVLTSSAVAVLVSHGRNGYGSTSSASGTTYVNPTSLNELANTNADRDFVSRVHSALDSAAGEFDDVVVWLPQFILFNRMVTAGKLP